MLFVFVAGPTHFILQTFVTGVGDYFSQLIQLSFDTRHYGKSAQWTKDWTITYLLWWVAWGPFVGVFIARISRGRTIREFIVGVLLVPTLFTLLWFAIMGGTGIYLDIFQNTELAAASTQKLTDISYLLIQELPWSFITTLITIFLIFIFLVTSADSGTYVLGMFTSDGDPEPIILQKLFWGVIIAIVSLGSVFLGDSIYFIRSFALVGAIPFLFIMLLQIYAFWKVLRTEK
jgi:glycine betaine transporter